MGAPDGRDLVETVAGRNTAVLRMTTAAGQSTQQPGWLRVTHWVNVIAVTLMVMSGWRIYNASPIFAFEFPEAVTLGGWLGGAIQWHFAAMWLLACNGLFYLACGLVTGRLRRQMFPLRIRQVWTDFTAALTGKLQHENDGRYNAVQKAAYLFAIADLILIVLSGLVIFKPVQFPVLRTLLGDFDNARIVHFVAMAALMGFLVVHVIMALLVPRTVLAMIRGH
jgi:thiosulfate reductase cytochrome b subunit